MNLFQKSVLNKYLKVQDESKVETAFEKLKLYRTQKEQIKSFNEEVFQDGFLKEIFVVVFGYKLNTIDKENYNLVREKKNVSDSKKADGAILKEGEVFCVIELKDTTTKDLTKVETQAFGYQSGHKNCNYVIISNFEKLNFYIKNKVDKIEFNLFTITLEEFKTLYLCLHADNLLTDVPLKVKEASLVEDEKVTKGLYKDYSAFKNALWENLCNNHPEEDKLFLFKKTQKLLDRFLFIFFGEDKGLLPPNSISSIITQWERLKELDEYKPLYDRFKKYFGYLNTGWKGKEYEIFAYNGGLFTPDELLDKVKIDDDVLHPHVMKLTAYDFESDVDVNILGHIFEHSLNEIESITAELEGKEVDKGKTKRKKDGVFYTPKYITKYIVENTVGKLCAEKKEELDIADEEYAKGRKNRKKETIKTLDKNLKVYRNWLLQITICDPACGSGAFLNQALEFLMQEHKYIDELESQLLGHSFEFPGVENHILENNLFGVDINEESVEIAKLSLWLRTAQKGRKLTSLNNNIKCGNSLIDDVEVAGDKAFNWVQEFPVVFEKGGFDVVIGNPPYVRVEFVSETDVKFYKDHYQSASSKFDLSSLFFEKSVEILNLNGIYSIITSYQFIYTGSGIGLRKFICDNTKCSVVMFSSDSQVFEGATTYAGIFIVQKAVSEKINILSANNKLQQVNITNKFTITRNNFTSAKVIVADTSLLEKIESNSSVCKGSSLGMAKTGVVTSADEVFYLTAEQVEEYKLEKDLVYPIIGPAELDRWILDMPETLCLYPYEEKDNKTTLIPFVELERKYSGIHKYLQLNKNKLISRSQGRKDYSESNNWYQLNRPREKWIYDSQKLIYPGTTNRPKFAFDEQGQVFRNARVYAYLLKPEYSYHYKSIMPILNSSLTLYLMSLKCPPKANNYYEMSTGFMETFPFILPEGSDKNDFEDIADKMIQLTRQFKTSISEFNYYVQSQFSIEKLTKNLQKWYKLEFGAFILELNKAVKKIGGMQLDDTAKYGLMKLFNNEKVEAQKLKAEIDKTDKEIDAMVYKLYDLTEEEIQIVENS